MTPQQLTALRAAIDATPAWAAFPMTGDGHYDLANLLSGQANPPFWVWSKRVEVQAIRAAVIWANLTPADAPDGTQAWANRSLQCQGKQFNLQMIVPMTGTLDSSDLNLRNGLQDALTGVRSGAGGVAQSAGWTAVQQVLSRRALFIEQILADTTVGNGSTRVQSASLVWEGRVTAADVAAARAL